MRTRCGTPVIIEGSQDGSGVDEYRVRSDSVEGPTVPSVLDDGRPGRRVVKGVRLAVSKVSP